MTDLIARRCWVSGRVQGVFFRASTRQKALELGISGYASNLADGRVEILAVGLRHHVEALLDWLKIGPPSARVDTLRVDDIAPDSLQDVPAGFTTH